MWCVGSIWCLPPFSVLSCHWRLHLILIFISTMLAGYNAVFQTLLGTLFTWGLTAAGAALVFVFHSSQVTPERSIVVLLPIDIVIQLQWTCDTSPCSVHLLRSSGEYSSVMLSQKLRRAHWRMIIKFSSCHLWVIPPLKRADTVSPKGVVTNILDISSGPHRLGLVCHIVNTLNISPKVLVGNTFWILHLRHYF